jgi:drug/metabolite transporter (DMT)-like permease
MKFSDDSRVWVAFWLAASFWGTSFLWIKLGVEGWDPLSLVAYRLTVACVFFGAYLAITRPKFKLNPRRLWVLPVVAFLNPYMPFLLITWAEVRIESGVASILNATVPLFMLGLTPLFLPSEKPTLTTFLGISIGFLGVALLFYNPGTSSSVASGYAGYGAVLLASFLYAISAILMKRYPLDVPAAVQAAAMNGTACVFVWVHACISGETTAPSTTVQLCSVLWLGALGSFAAYSCAMYVLQKRGAVQTTLINFAYPLIGLCLGIFFLGETFKWRLVIGGALILGGIGLVQIPVKRFFAFVRDLKPLFK